MFAPVPRNRRAWGLGVRRIPVEVGVAGPGPGPGARQKDLAQQAGAGR